MLTLYNTLTRSKEQFEPLNPPFAGMYVCGPTVYGHSHLGHGKSYVSLDVLVRYLRYLGYKVRYVQNITDVGHLTDDADAGEDKLQKQARLEKLEPMEIAEKYTASYFRDMDALNVLRPDISPRASGHIPEQIEMVRKLIEKGHAYEVNGDVYFDVSSFSDYGKLSGRKGNEALSGSRVDTARGKRDPRDFALWKSAGDDHILRWNSPWGWGYPGWHLECSAMAMRYLGETVDIHCGGIENSFPHHECEIAQSEAVTGKPFVRYWVHNNMVTVEGQKMGKSLGNFTLLRDLFANWHPMVVRLYILRSHYRSPLDFSKEGLAGARSGLERLVSFRNRLGTPEAGEPSEKVLELVKGTREAFENQLDDDLNTPGALAAVFDFVRSGNTILEGNPSDGDRRAMADLMDVLVTDVLGIVLESGGADNSAEALCAILGELRGYLRKNKLFAQADKMRDDLKKAGYSVQDLPGGVSRVVPDL
ncbi:cysteine--tRNA ligase [Candidatus Fermentibacteria bacterium]|nr:MAG: cysteine--tRNA ligase [Candidatus Fermentibacteria bacterium]